MVLYAHIVLCKIIDNIEKRDVREKYVVIVPVCELLFLYNSQLCFCYMSKLKRIVIYYGMT
jgi:hypothetical protein